jgi:transposase
MRERGRGRPGLEGQLPLGKSRAAGGGCRWGIDAAAGSGIVALDAAAAGDGRARAQRSFSARARQAVFLQAHGHSRSEVAALIGVAPETISVWRRHPQWGRELERWRALAEAPQELRLPLLQRQLLAAAGEALEQLGLIMERATRQRRTSAGLKEVPDSSTRQKACGLVLAYFFALYWLLLTGEGNAPGIGRTLRIVP